MGKKPFQMPHGLFLPINDKNLILIEEILILRASDYWILADLSDFDK